MTLFVIRHGQTAWNAELRLQGQRDIPLNALGLAQAAGNGIKLKAAAGDLSAFHFVASPLERARQTMELVRENAGLPKHGYDLEPRLMELCFGDWEGHTLDEIEAKAPEKLAERDRNKWDFVPPGDFAESYEILSWRVGSWLNSVDRPTVAVAHGGVIRSVFRLVAGLDKESAAKMDIPQDRILKVEAGTVAWL